jgi:hypothetical protein
LSQRGKSAAKSSQGAVAGRLPNRSNPFLKAVNRNDCWHERKEQLLMTPEQIGGSRTIGECIARLRRARNVLQAEASIRAGI